MASAWNVTYDKIQTGNSLVNQRLDMTNKLKMTNARSPAHKRDTKRPTARERIFNTAGRLFYTKGIRAVGVDTIAAQADTTKMSLYRNFSSKDELVAEWLRDHDTQFWQTWDATMALHPDDPRGQLKAAFALLQKHVVDPETRGCPMANAAVELTESGHPARKVIEAHKARLRARLTKMCTQMGARSPGLLADQLYLLMEGAQITIQTLGLRGPAKNAARAAEMLIAAHMRAT